MVNTKPGRDSDQFALRLPDGMRDRIKAAASENGRSMNAEIVSTLEEKYPKPIDSHYVLEQMFIAVAELAPEKRQMFIDGLMSVWEGAFSPERAELFSKDINNSLAILEKLEQLKGRRVTVEEIEHYLAKAEEKRLRG